MNMLIYNTEIFNSFKAKSIQNASEFEKGKTYFSNSHPGNFVFYKLLTTDEVYRNIGSECDSAEKHSVNWILTTNGQHLSLRDLNIGACYNPWLVFTDEETRDQCEKELVVTFERDLEDMDSISDYDYEDDTL
jgi:hypothetical protein